MKDDINLLIVIFAVIIIILIAIYGHEYEKNKNEWNNGYCSCGGHWKYKQSVEDGDNTTYIYRCDNCGKTIEVEEVQAFVVTIKNGI